jgi:hypothetical protein
MTTLPQTRPIPNASDYALLPSGYVFNTKTCKRLRRWWNGERWKTLITNNDGKRVHFAHDSLDSPDVELSLEHILEFEGAKPLPEFPRFAITSYGCVYCIKPESRGRTAGRVSAVSEFMRGDTRYVSLKHESGIRKQVPVDKLVKSVWGEV